MAATKMVRNQSREEEMPYKVPMLLCVLGLTAFMDVTTAQTPLDPQKVVTLADVQTLLKGKFTARVVEPGLVKYEEAGAPREVEVSFFIQYPGKTVDGVKQSVLQNSEPVEDVPGVGDAAIYRPQGGLVIVEKKNKAGELQWLEVRVHNVEGADSAATTKRLAIELARLAATRH
jgi:hypothetical protein